MRQTLDELLGLVNQGEKPSVNKSEAPLRAHFQKLISNTNTIKRFENSLWVRISTQLNKNTLQKQSHRKPIYLISAFAVLMFFLTIFIMYSAFKVKSEASLVFFEGDVRVDQTSLATENLVQINPGEIITVGEKSNALLIIENWLIVWLTPGTIFEFDQNSMPNLTRLNVHNGKIIIKGEKSRKSNPNQGLQVSSLNLETHIIGTEFSVAVAGEVAQVNLNEGQVKIEAGENQQPILLKAGQNLIAQNNEIYLTDMRPESKEDFLIFKQLELNFIFESNSKKIPFDMLRKILDKIHGNLVTPQIHGKIDKNQWATESSSLVRIIMLDGSEIIGEILNNQKEIEVKVKGKIRKIKRSQISQIIAIK